MTQWTSLHAAGSISKRSDIMIPYSHRRRASESRTEAEFTESTNRSSTLLSRGGNDCSSDNKSWGGMFSRIKLPGRRWRNRRKPLSETRLREKLIKRADKGDWGGVRKLISNFEFSDIPEPLLPCTKIQNNNSSVQMMEEGPHQSSKRRPSYGSRSGDRLSFTGKESAAAAAAIKAALLEESSASSSSEKPNTGENVLHDMCRYDPPLDVLETLLASLRHRRGTTSGTDDMGRTPLHVASAFGANHEVIDALTRADPRPASMGDIDGRSPLHIAVRCLAYGATDNNALEGTEQTRLPLRRNSGHDGPSKEEILRSAAKTILLLKKVMLSYPGKIDFKDEDNSGFAPVDYALDGDVTGEYLLHCLLTRKHSSRKRRSMHSVASSDTQLTSNLGQTVPRQGSGISSVSSDVQDIAVLQRLEEEEIRDRRNRLDKMPRPKKQMKDVLFDVFGIEEHLECGPSDNPPSTEGGERLDPPDRGNSEKSSGATTPKSMHRSSKLSSSRSSSKLNAKENDCRSMTDSAIYNHHLQAYLNDFAGGDGLEFYDDDDDFDIHHDPEEDIDAEGLYDSAWIGPGKPPMIEIDIAFDSMDDDNLSQCSYARSVVSEVTVPVR
mmetsp:Transcript_15076/g.30720  ORF Transcript_15076/g.30720 Transcript_15076/m.30720 type:complete len:609 (-) Transcript_15076:75-1901(-)